MIKKKALKLKIFFLIIFLLHGSMHAHQAKGVNFFDLPLEVIEKIAAVSTVTSVPSIVKMLLYKKKSIQKVLEKVNASELIKKKSEDDIKISLFLILFFREHLFTIEDNKKCDVFLSLIQTENILDVRHFKCQLKKEPQCFILHDGLKRNILHYAAAQGNVAFVQFFFSYHKKCFLKLKNEKDFFQKTPFQIAQAKIFETTAQQKQFLEGQAFLTDHQKRFLFITSIFLEGDEKDMHHVIDSFQETFSKEDFFLAIHNRSLDVIKKMLLHEYKKYPQEKKLIEMHLFNTTPFLYALSNGMDLSIIQILMAAGSDINGVVNQQGSTPLMLAVMHKKKSTVEVFLAAGAEVNVTNEWGETVLMRAIYGKNKAIVNALIAAGVDIHVVDGWGETPLVHAVMNQNIDIVKAFIAAGADMYSVNIFGETVLMQVALSQNLDIMKVFIAAGAPCR